MDCQGAPAVACAAGPGTHQSRYFTRSKMVNEYKAAGILPWTVLNGVPFCLLGAEPRRTGPGGSLTRTMWSNFGGLREAGDNGDSILTASREFAEETLGIFASASVTAESVLASAEAMATSLRSSERRRLHVTHKLRKGEYHFYVTQTSYVEPMFFHLAAQSNLVTGAIPGGEKTAFAWVPFHGLLSSVAQARPRYFLDPATRHTAIRGHPPSAHHQMQLHPCFATSLRIAMGAGLESQLVQACASAVPPPPLCALLPAPCPVPAGIDEPNAPEGAAGQGGQAVSRLGKRGRGKQQRRRRRAKQKQQQQQDASPDPTKHLLYWLQQEEVMAELSPGCPSAEHKVLVVG